jgi:hypothetical protein
MFQLFRIQTRCRLLFVLQVSRCTLHWEDYRLACCILLASEDLIFKECRLLFTLKHFQILAFGLGSSKVGRSAARENRLTVSNSSVHYERWSVLNHPRLLLMHVYIEA